MYYPVSDGKRVYFVSPHSGIDNIYAAEIASKRIYQVTSRLFGAYYPSLSPDGKKLVFSDVTADGYIAMEMQLDPGAWIPIEKVEDRSIRYYEPLIAQEAGSDITKDIPSDSYESKKFNSFTHLIDIKQLASHGGSLLARALAHGLIDEPVEHDGGVGGIHLQLGTSARIPAWSTSATRAGTR